MVCAETESSVAKHLLIPQLASWETGSDSGGRMQAVNHFALLQRSEQ